MNYNILLTALILNQVQLINIDTDIKCLNWSAWNNINLRSCKSNLFNVMFQPVENGSTTIVIFTVIVDVAESLYRREYFT